MSKSRKDENDEKDVKSAHPNQKAAESGDEEGVDEASDESFPASDPPSSQPLHTGAPDKNAHREAQ